MILQLQLFCVIKTQQFPHLTCEMTMAVTTNNDKQLLSDMDVVQKILSHIDNKTTDMGNKTWKEPVAHYRSKERLNAELKILQGRSIVFCPSSAFINPDQKSLMTQRPV